MKVVKVLHISKTSALPAVEVHIQSESKLYRFVKFILNMSGVF